MKKNFFDSLENKSAKYKSEFKKGSTLSWRLNIRINSLERNERITKRMCFSDFYLVLAN